jgi:hypothetical protein
MTPSSHKAFQKACETQEKVAPMPGIDRSTVVSRKMNAVPILTETAIALAALPLKKRPKMAGPGKPEGISP